MADTLANFPPDVLIGDHPRGRILVIDDEPDIRERLEALLSSENYQVELAVNAADGQKRMEQSSFDLVLIDKNFRVVGLRELVHPFTITRPNFRAESVLELPAHSIFRSRTQIGDQIVIDRYEAKRPPKSGGAETIVQLPPRSSELDLPRSSYADSKTR